MAADPVVAVAVDVAVLSLAAPAEDGPGPGSTDVAVDGTPVRGDEPPQDARSLVVLATRRASGGEPGRDGWALPGGRVRDDEDLEQAARRWLAARGGLTRVRHLEQLATFGAPGRDPTGRVVSVSYLALLPAPPPAAAVTEPAADAAWWPVDDVPTLAYDHDAILATAVARLRGKLSYSTVAYGLLPDTFTLRELQAVYEAVLDRDLDKRNFRKKVLALGMLDTAPGQRRGPHRPAQLYRFAGPGVALLDDVTST